MTSAIDSAPPPVTTRPDPGRLGPIRRTVREIGLALITLGMVVLLFVVYELFGTGIAESHSQHQLAKQFSAEAAKVHSPPAASTDNPTVGSQQTLPAVTLPSVPPGGAVDHLVIPKIGLDKFVVEGTNEEDLRRGPGHYTGTAYPGQMGNAAIAGHRTTFGAPFFRLGEMAPGDPIYITDLTGHTWLYKVSGPPQVVSPSDVAVLDPTPFAQLTLTTCNPKFSATSRLVVFARLSGPAEPLVRPAPASAPAAAKTQPGATASSAGPTALAQGSLGRGQSGAWGPTLLYGALALVLWVATRVWIHRSRRWWRAAAVVVGIAVCLVPLWFCFENAVLLLPQSF